jgi:Lrp/AsnC family transcriptional regulator for asnA, asnC and gidA
VAGSPLFSPDFDRLDIGIIRILQHDGRTTTRQLAASLNTTEMTVRKRLKRLLESKAIDVRAFIEPSRLGYAHEAILSLQVRIGQVETTAATLADFPEVRYVAITSGAYDIVCTVIFFEIESLLRFTTDKLSKIEGIVSSHTAFSLKVVKRASEWLPALEEAADEAR